MTAILCHDCEEWGEPRIATRTWDRGRDYAFWTGKQQYIHVCEEHWWQRDNYEPPEPDGECFRGKEAAAYENE
jgi:hypothetical protein